MGGVPYNFNVHVPMQAQFTEAATAARDKDKAKREAAGRLRSIRRNAIKLTLNCIGDPNMVAKSIIEVRGIGELLSGLYYVESIKHGVSTSGYKMQLKVRRDGPARPRADATEDESTDGTVNAARATRENATNQLAPTGTSDPDQVGGTAVEFTRTGGRQN